MEDFTSISPGVKRCFSSRMGKNPNFWPKTKHKPVKYQQLTRKKVSIVGQDKLIAEEYRHTDLEDLAKVGIPRHRQRDEEEKYHIRDVPMTPTADEIISVQWRIQGAPSALHQPQMRGRFPKPLFGQFSPKTPSKLRNWVRVAYTL